LHGDDPDALETVLRYLYGLDAIELPTNDMGAKVIRSVQVIITADKYGIDRQLIENHTNMLTISAVCKVKDPQTVLSILTMCTVDSDIHPLLVSTVDLILRTHMGKLAEVPEWFDWTHSMPEVNRKISREAAQMMNLKCVRSVWACGGCGDWVFSDPATDHDECSCGSDGSRWFSQEAGIE